MFKWLKALFAPSSPNVTEEAIDWPPGFQMTPDGKPRTLAAEQENKHLTRPLVFEPALRQYSAFRAGEPVFASDTAARRWYQLRSRVLQHILMQISQSPASEHLVLRGSLAMSIWFGQNARRPGDIDWVVIPQDWHFVSNEAIDLIETIEKCVQGNHVEGAPAFTIPDREFVSDDIWMYEKAPGKRLIIPWECEDPTLNGTVQMDLVFEEILPSEPELINIAPPDQPAVQMLAASVKQSLAWKLVWLTNDHYAQGKDLYDAVLLAENSTLDAELLRDTFEVSDQWTTARPNPICHFDADMILDWYVEWDDFKKEYPHIPGTEEQWKHRLILGLDALLTQLYKSRNPFA